jgi:hypothetical protein
VKANEALGSQANGDGPYGPSLVRKVAGVLNPPTYHREVQASEPDREIEQTDGKINGHVSHHPLLSGSYPNAAHAPDGGVSSWVPSLKAAE